MPEVAATLALPQPLVLPPFGFVNSANEAFLRGRPVPEDFRLDPEQSALSGADEWEAWLENLALELADFLWPVFRQGQWQGAAVANMVALTQADLALMEGESGRDGGLLALFQARIATAAGPGARHSEAWQVEDEPAPGPSLALYQPDVAKPPAPAWPQALQPELDRAIRTGGSSMARPASQGLKRMLQRPRPQISALLLGRPALAVQASKSAITPSMVSGHCIQGTLALAKIFVELEPVLAAQPALKPLLQRYLIDTGDRRVYAGLHFPSDNIGSWYTALRLCRHLFGKRANDVREFLWQAVKEHSTVYTAMRAAVWADKKSPFARPLHALQRAAQNRALDA